MGSNFLPKCCSMIHLCSRTFLPPLVTSRVLVPGLNPRRTACSFASDIFDLLNCSKYCLDNLWYYRVSEGSQSVQPGGYPIILSIQRGLILALPISVPLKTFPEPPSSSSRPPQ